jgi:hypothetical protein
MTEFNNRISLKKLSAEDRAARDRQRHEDAQRALREHAEAQHAFHANRERLKAERLAREAAAQAGDEVRTQGVKPGRND